MTDWLRTALGLGDQESAFPWQEDLLQRFRRGEIPPALDIPTGLGKTAVMAIWLVARAQGAPLPRRLAYVVDRRAVVDQATTEAERLRAWVEQTDVAKRALGLDRELPISTLRGQHIDNREWLEDPSVPAIIVGTIDMVGSRLLFEGYGVSRKMRPYHAGLLGADTLVVLDEAHLVPPFERLIAAIARDCGAFAPRGPAPRGVVPRFELLSLSATGREVEGALGLTAADLDHPIVRKRIVAPKRLRVEAAEEGDDLGTSLATKAWQLSKNGNAAMRCIVFCDRREDAARAQAIVEKWAKDNEKTGAAQTDIQTELFVGARRVYEREAAARRLAELGFLAGTTERPTITAYLFATSAAEVGVDLDADHMVCDLVAWERMVQRFGRVNRRGDGDARVVVVSQPPRLADKKLQAALDKPEKDREAKDIERIAAYEAEVAFTRACRRALDALPVDAGFADASPGALRQAKEDGRLTEILHAATTPEPLRPALSRALVDAWSMTSLAEHTGRPEVEPWLRGWRKDEPQTSIVWRRHLPVMHDGSLARKRDVEAFFEAAPPHAIEALETETYRAVEWLMKRAEALAKRAKAPHDEGNEDKTPPLRLSDIAAIALTSAGDLRQRWMLADLLETKPREAALRAADPDERARIAERAATSDAAGRGKTKETLARIAARTTLVVDCRLGGLGASGLLDEEADELPGTVDDDARSLCPVDSGVPRVRFRVWSTDGIPAVPSGDWRTRFQLAIDELEEEEATYLVVEKWRHDAANEEDRSAAHPQLLDEHESWAERQARRIAAELCLGDYAEMLAIAARLHDEGKRARRWQRAFNARRDGVYAKTKGPINYALLDGYRHELGSLSRAEKHERLLALPDEQRDLALHLIAAHHGYARPNIGTSGCDEGPPSALEAKACEVALRFARLQRRWGPWGLAWWESLLRAADQQASRLNDEREVD